MRTELKRSLLKVVLEAKRWPGPEERFLPPSAGFLRAPDTALTLGSPEPGHMQIQRQSGWKASFFTKTSGSKAVPPIKLIVCGGEAGKTVSWTESFYDPPQLQMQRES